MEKLKERTRMLWNKEPKTAVIWVKLHICSHKATAQSPFHFRYEPLTNHCQFSSRCNNCNILTWIFCLLALQSSKLKMIVSTFCLWFNCCTDILQKLLRKIIINQNSFAIISWHCYQRKGKWVAPSTLTYPTTAICQFFSA